MKRIHIMLMILLLIMSCCTTTRADVESFTIAQIYQEYIDDTRLHVRVESTGMGNGRTTQITPESIEKATIGTGTTPVLNVHAMTSEQSEGMTFLFILDHAMPIGSDRVKELKKGVNTWIDAMGEKDCAAILVAEKDEIRRLTNGFITDKDALHAAVNDYGQANEDISAKNMIFSAIREGILITANQAGTRPRNCYIIVCSNGVDTYQTLVTAEEISSLLSENNLPLYVVGYAYKNTKASLAALINIARNSGGWSEDATPSNDQGTIDEAFDRLRTRILSGFDITLDCSDGFVFNGSTLVSLKLKNQDTPIKRMADLYLLKKDEPTPAPARQAAKQALQPISVPKKPTEKNGIASSSVISVVAQNDVVNRIMSLVLGNAHYFVIGGLIICGLIAFVLHSRKKSNTLPKDDPHSDIPEPPTDILPQSDGFSGNTEVVTGKESGLNVPAGTPPTDGLTDRGGRTGGTNIGPFTPPSFIQKIVFVYQIPGQDKKTVTFNNPMEISIGRRSGNTLVLDSSKVSSNHAKIWFEENRVWIDNISRIVNGKKNDLYVDSQCIEKKTALPTPCHINIATVSMDVSYELTDKQMTVIRSMPSQMNDDGRVTVRKTPLSENTERGIPLQITWSLRGTSGSKRISLVHQITIGRSESDTVSILDPEATVSQHHVILERKGNEIIVRNGSKEVAGIGRNPFYYNNDGITEQTPFEDGMNLFLGDAKVTIRIMHGM